MVRRRATLPHPVGCSTIAVPGLSFRVRNGTGRLSWAMAAANLGLSAGKRGFPPACGGSGTGQWTRLLLTDRARVRTVLPVRLRGALPGPAPHTLAGVWMWVASRPLVPVGSTPRGASTSGLSTTCSAWGLQRLGAAWNPYLGEGFPLRCFQRLSLPNVANRMISLLSPGYLLSVERCRARAPAPDHYLRLSSLLDPSISQSSPLVRLHSTPDCQPGRADL